MTKPCDNCCCWDDDFRDEDETADRLTGSLKRLHELKSQIGTKPTYNESNYSNTRRSRSCTGILNNNYTVNYFLRRMDHKEEQDNELEVLESIYPSEFWLIGQNPCIFQIFVKSDNFKGGEDGFCAVLRFQFPPLYPEVVPVVNIVTNNSDSDELIPHPDEEDNNETNLEPYHIHRLLKFLSEIAQENLGMPMVYTIVKEAQEWLNKQYDMEQQEKEEAEARLAEEAEEAERNRFEGTKVNVLNFMQWKMKFDAEMGIKKQSVVEKERELIGNKLTGKELFLRDSTLNESDLKFVEDGEMTIDEELFADVDDLDLLDIEDDEDEEELRN